MACLQTCYMPERHVDTAAQPQDSQDLQGLNQLEETAAYFLSGKSLSWCTMWEIGIGRRK